MKGMPYKRYILLIIAFSRIFPAIATDFERQLGARSWGLASASVTFSDLWSVQNNQAGLGFIKQSQAGTYGEQRFRLSNLSFASVAGIIATKQGSFGLNVNYFGYSAYSEQRFGFSFGRAFSEKFAFGFQLNYQLLAIREYGNAGNATIQGGVIYKPNKQLHIGVHLANPTLQKLDKTSQTALPTVARLGIQYLPSEKVSLIAETEKNLDLDMRVKIAAEYRVHNQLCIRAGLATNPFLNTFGIGYQNKNMHFDLAAGIHPLLGITPHASFTYLFGKKK